MELNEIGGSLHGAPGILEVDGRQLSPLHGSRWCSQPEVPPSLPKAAPRFRRFLRGKLGTKDSALLPAELSASPLPSEEGGSDLSEIPSLAVSEGEILEGLAAGRGAARHKRAGEAGIRVLRSRVLAFSTTCSR